MSIEFKDSSTDLDASLNVHPITQDMKLKVNEDSILQHIELLLMMEENALLGRPGVCAGLRQFVFEDDSLHTKNVLINRIISTLEFEPRIDVISVDVDFDISDCIITIKFIFIHTNREFTYISTLKRVI